MPFGAGFAQGFLQTLQQGQQQALENARAQQELERRKELHKLESAILKGREAKMQLEAQEAQQKQQMGQEMLQSIMADPSSEKTKTLMLAYQARHGRGALRGALGGGYGRELHYGVGQDGKPVPLVLHEGQLVQPSLPEGVTGVWGTTGMSRPLSVDTGTGTALVAPGPAGGQPGGAGQVIIPKNVGEREEEEAIGHAAGKQAQEAPIKKLEMRAALDDVKVKQAGLVQPGGALDRLIALAPKAAGTANLLDPVNYLRLLNYKQERADLESTITSLRANLGISELERIKTAGGTLSPVTDSDIRLLSSLLSELDVNMSPQALTAAAQRLKTALGEQLKRREQLYQEKFGRTPNVVPGTRVPSTKAREQKPSTAPAAPSNPYAPPKPLAEMSDEEIAAYKALVEGRP